MRSINTLSSSLRSSVAVLLIAGLAQSSIGCVGQPDTLPELGETKLAIADDPSLADRFDQFRQTMGDDEIALFDESTPDDQTYIGTLIDPDTGLSHTFTVAWNGDSGVTVTESASQQVVLSIAGDAEFAMVKLGGTVSTYDADDTLQDADDTSAAFLAQALNEPRAAQLAMRALVRSIWLSGLDQAAFTRVTMEGPEGPFGEPGAEPQHPLVLIAAAVGLFASVVVIQVSVSNANYQNAVEACANAKATNETEYLNQVSQATAYKCSYSVVTGQLRWDPVTVSIKNGQMCQPQYFTKPYTYPRGFIADLFGVKPGVVMCGPLRECNPITSPDTIASIEPAAVAAFCGAWAQANPAGGVKVKLPAP